MLKYQINWGPITFIQKYFYRICSPLPYVWPREYLFKLLMKILTVAQQRLGIGAVAKGTAKSLIFKFLFKYIYFTFIKKAKKVNN